MDAEAFDEKLPDLITNAEGAIRHALERGQPDSDIELVRDAIIHLRVSLRSVSDT